MRSAAPGLSPRRSRTSRVRSALTNQGASRPARISLNAGGSQGSVRRLTTSNAARDSRKAERRDARTSLATLKNPCSRGSWSRLAWLEAFACARCSAATHCAKTLGAGSPSRGAMGLALSSGFAVGNSRSRRSSSVVSCPDRGGSVLAESGNWSHSKRERSDATLLAIVAAVPRKAASPMVTSLASASRSSRSWRSAAACPVLNSHNSRSEPAIRFPRSFSVSGYHCVCLKLMAFTAPSRSENDAVSAPKRLTHSG